LSPTSHKDPDERFVDWVPESPGGRPPLGLYLALTLFIALLSGLLSRKRRRTDLNEHITP
jgi:hypothetical protein